MTHTVISVLLPTRGRTHALKKSLHSLISTAKNAKRIELLLGIDEDDTEVKQYIQSEIAPMLREAEIECRAQVFKPLGYHKLNVYVNTLAGIATGDWLFFWNDDAIMLSENWDEQIDKYTGQFKLLAPRDNHDGHPYAILPIVPMGWFKLMDHLSLNAQNDAWLSHIAYMLDIFERIDVEFLHDRADLTGNNDDDTFKNREYKEGNPEDPEDFGHPAMQQARVRSAFKIAWYLEKIGQRSEWWERVQRGEVQPFEKMVFGENVKGAGQFQAKKHTVSDDEKLIL